MKTLFEYMNWPRIEAVVYAEENAPKDVLGARVTEDGVLLQCFFPDAAEVVVETGEEKKRYPMEEQDEAGYFAVLLPLKNIPKYTYLVTEKEGEEPEPYKDPYIFPCRID